MDASGNEEKEILQVAAFMFGVNAALYALGMHTPENTTEVMRVVREVASQNFTFTGSAAEVWQKEGVQFPVEEVNKEIRDDVQLAKLVLRRLWFIKGAE